MDIEKPIRILLADDHPVVMLGFSTALESYEIETVGQATSPEEAVRQFHDLRPDVLVLDIRFGAQQSGLEVAKRILQRHPTAKIVFMSQFDQDALIRNCYRLGASAFVTKDVDPPVLAAAIKRVHGGEVFFLPHVAERLANLSIHNITSPQEVLEEREMEVFKLLAHGFTVEEIAEKLDLSRRTVAGVSKSIQQKLGIDRAADLTKLAVKHMLIEP